MYLTIRKKSSSKLKAIIHSFSKIAYKVVKSITIRGRADYLRIKLVECSVGQVLPSWAASQMATDLAPVL